jgi:hypothetical protein
MTARTLTLHHQTRIAVSVIIEDDTGVFIWSILIVTRLLAFLGRAFQRISTVHREFLQFVTDFKTAFDFTTKIFVIGVNSLAYGLGVEL